MSKKIALVANSNPLSPQAQAEVVQLQAQLQANQIEVVLSPLLFQTTVASSGAERGAVLRAFYSDPTITGIFDVSGGDLSNEVLPHLPYDLIASSPTFFAGYSDLTTLINGMYSQTGQGSYLYQIRQALKEPSGVRWQELRDFLTSGKMDLFNPSWRLIQGQGMAGVVVGGNLRSFLKLVGTPYLPELRGKLLLLESLSGDEKRIRTSFQQLKQMGVFEQVSGVLLGTFTELTGSHSATKAVSLLQDVLAQPDLPLASTLEIGHGLDAKGLMIGRELVI